MRAQFAWLLLAAAAPVFGDDLPAFPFIHVAGHALKTVAPDLARVNFTVKARDPNAEVAARAVSDRAGEVLDLLGHSGIAAADIDAHETGKQVVFDREPGLSSGARRGPPHYEVSRTFSVVVRNLAAWPDLGTRLLEMQNVEEIEAQFDRTDHAALEAELVSAAARDAQQRAERLAAGFGQRLGVVQAISQDQFDEISIRMLRADMRYLYEGGAALGATAGYRSREAAAQVLVPATIPLGASVNAIYRLETAAH